MASGRPASRVVGLLGGLALIGVLLGVFALAFARGSSPGPAAQLGRQAPAFALERLGGGRLALDELRGKPIILNFWASWCLPCRDEAPMLTGLAADYASHGLQVVGIVYRDDTASAIDFMSRYGQTYPGLLDPGQRTALDYGVFGVPETYFIDAAGAIRARQLGPLSASALRSTVEKILP
ncbi:MAG: cytochrome c biosis protein CcmG, thiol:disulfide interchange protein DsbE [Chloroflexota bacterium]|jgi:cytochrome c biogenesis protein CcmG/thiol:disulfide interchange protein DsbE|nr:cytochrome c biosis protein CcmG, thiol:disulfide interchange protein DsbE [Chloroflexota bacterium]